MSWGHAEERKWTEKWGPFIYGISKRIAHLCIEIDKSLQRALIPKTYYKKNQTAKGRTLQVKALHQLDLDEHVEAVSKMRKGK